MSYCCTSLWACGLLLRGEQPARHHLTAVVTIHHHHQHLLLRRLLESADSSIPAHATARPATSLMPLAGVHVLELSAAHDLQTLTGWWLALPSRSQPLPRSASGQHGGRRWPRYGRILALVVALVSATSRLVASFSSSDLSPLAAATTNATRSGCRRLGQCDFCRCIHLSTTTDTHSTCPRPSQEGA